MRIENDLIVCGQCMFVQCDAIAVKKDRWSDPEIEIDNLLVDGEKPNEELAEQVYAVIEHEYYGEILDSMPTDDDLRSLHDDARWDEYYQSDRYKRRVA